MEQIHPDELEMERQILELIRKEANLIGRKDEKPMPPKKDS